jgi:hypothetical protein
VFSYEGFLDNLDKLLFIPPDRVNYEFSGSAILVKDCAPIVTYGSPSWATAIKKDGAWHIVVNGNIVAGPYQDAETPTLSPSGERWASKVLLQEGGWTIAFNAVDESKKPKLFPKTFDLVSKPWFVMGGGILFAGLKGDVVELYLID